jgi:hypothetical protein
MGVELGQALLDGGAEQVERGEVAIMSGAPLHVPPEVLNRVGPGA